MKIKTLLFSKTFPHPANGTWEKIGLEAEVTPDEDVRSCLYALKKEVEQFHFQSLGHDEKIVKEQKAPDLSEEQQIIEGINSSNKQWLEKLWKMKADYSTKTREAYDNKFSELNKQ